MIEEYKSFYDRPVWKQLRFRVLKKYGYKCMSCGLSRDEEKVVIHVDHIKPVSIYPELALIEENLQVLCRDCNQGKSNLHQDDLRPKLKAVGQKLNLSPDLEEKLQNLKQQMIIAEEEKNPVKFADAQKDFLNIHRSIRGISA